MNHRYRTTAERNIVIYSTRICGVCGDIPKMNLGLTCNMYGYSYTSPRYMFRVFRTVVCRQVLSMTPVSFFLTYFLPPMLAAFHVLSPQRLSTVCKQ